MSEQVESAGDAATPDRQSRRGVLYPNHYVWYIFAATLDVIVTHQILHQFKGSEVNQLADALIRRYGVLGMIGLKYSSIVLVVLICEFVGRRRLKLGRRLATLAVIISAFPVGVGLLQIKVWTLMSHHPPPSELRSDDPEVDLDPDE